MIKKLKHTAENIAGQIYQVFQKSYQIEANLIGVDDFPPLNRSVQDIQSSSTAFYGFYKVDCLAAVIEINTKADYMKICSLTVDPSYFRKGMAGKLVNFVFGLTDVPQYEVETAVVNEPAITLYKKYGFVEFNRYLPSHGIPKVVMRRSVTP